MWLFSHSIQNQNRASQPYLRQFCHTEAKRTSVLPAELGRVGKALAAVGSLGWCHQQASCGGRSGRQAFPLFTGRGQVLTRQGWGGPGTLHCSQDPRGCCCAQRQGPPE